MTSKRKEYLRLALDDGLPAAHVGPWAEEKYRRVGMYAEIFSTGMKNRWGSRVYLDLFAGPGHAVIRDTGMRVMTSPLLALAVQRPFDKYIFCDSDQAKVQSLQARATQLNSQANVAYVCGDANQCVTQIEELIPVHSRAHTVLSFCFVDPFGLDIHFETIRRLGANRAMDFLILLALGMDATRNWASYLNIGNEKVDRFLGRSTWRPDWLIAEKAGKSPIRFLAEEYQTAMQSIGYFPPRLDRMIEVRTRDNNMRLYYLAFFSKSERGYEFWDEVRKYSTDQLTLL